mmetsp:Transcript_27704/g.67434  ORF Transcript_27704/g.67434 Transcript_27704/m.67434 type:complete len:87 (-) Transcript_27704:694-954(-)
MIICSIHSFYWTVIHSSLCLAVNSHQPDHYHYYASCIINPCVKSLSKMIPFKDDSRYPPKYPSSLKNLKTLRVMFHPKKVYQADWR